MVLHSYGWLLPGTFSVKRASWQKGVTGIPGKMVWESLVRKRAECGERGGQSTFKKFGSKAWQIT